MHFRAIQSSCVCTAALFFLTAQAAIAQETFWIANDCKIGALDIREINSNGARTWTQCQNVCLQSARLLQDPNRCTGFTFDGSRGILAPPVVNRRGVVWQPCQLHRGSIPMGSGRPAPAPGYVAGTVVDLSAWDPSRPVESLDKDCDWLSTPEYHIFRRDPPGIAPNGLAPSE